MREELENFGKKQDPTSRCEEQFFFPSIMGIDLKF